MIKLKNPKVRMFIGRVRITIKGLIKVLTTDKITETTSAVKKPSTLTPGNI